MKDKEAIIEEVIAICKQIKKICIVININ